MRQMSWNVEDSRRLLANIPDAPGVYLMRDREGSIVYIGKALSLSSRVAQYFHKSGDTRPFVALLSGLLDRIDTVVTSNEKEALLLESELIKRHKPPFNILLRDDKAYLYLRIDPREPYPRLDLVRRRKPDGALYFGPHHNASSIRGTHALVNRHFGLRTCRDNVFRNRSRPCLEHQMGRCLGPCAIADTEEEYARRVAMAVMFLKGRRDVVKRRLEALMQAAATAENFEEAARIRDQLRALEASLTRQAVVLPRMKDTDAVGIMREGELISIAVLRFEAGALVERIPYRIDQQPAPIEDLIESFLLQFYGRSPIPAVLLLPRQLPPDPRALSQVLGGMCRHAVQVRQPTRGPEASAVKMAMQNAELLLREALATDEAHEQVLARLASLLGIPVPRGRIEAYDMSTFQADATVGAMVVFVRGRPEKRSYRTFAVRGTEGPGDVGMMREVLQRRFAHAPDEMPLPDLVLLDGGEAQLAVAIAALGDAGLSRIPLVALAKSRVTDDAKAQAAIHSPERLVVPGPDGPRHIVPPQHDDGLRFLMRMRDEVHRFAITFHRKRRARKESGSLLDGLPGLGRKRRTALLRHFGSLAAVRAATLEELRQAAGMTAPVAEAVYARLHATDASEAANRAPGNA